MKSTIAYYLLIIYTAVILNPAMPVVFDALAHSFAESEHELTVHAKYGNDHLQKEIAGAEDTNNKHQNGAKCEEQVNVHLPSPEFSVNTHFTESRHNLWGFLTFNFTSIIILPHAPPPRNPA